jgi:hypothetical protein
MAIKKDKHTNPSKKKSSKAVPDGIKSCLIFMSEDIHRETKVTATENGMTLQDYILDSIIKNNIYHRKPRKK